MVAGALLLALGSARAWVAFDKVITNEQLTVGEGAWVKFTIYNLGDIAIEDVNMGDVAIPEKYWRYNKNETNAHWDAIYPGQNVTHMFVVTPLVAGKMTERLNQANVHYKADGVQHTVWSTNVFIIDVKVTRSIGAAGSLLAYFVVVGAAAGLVAIPYIFWRRANGQSWLAVGAPRR